MTRPPFNNGTFDNAVAKLWHGYTEGRSVYHNTCYAWVGDFLHHHPAYDNPHTDIRFWGIRCDSVAASRIIHGDAITPFLGDPAVLGQHSRLITGSRLVISTSPDRDYHKQSLIITIAWTDFKLRCYRLADCAERVGMPGEPLRPVAPAAEQQ